MFSTTTLKQKTCSVEANSKLVEGLLPRAGSKGPSLDLAGPASARASAKLPQRERKRLLFFFLKMLEPAPTAQQFMRIASASFRGDGCFKKGNLSFRELPNMGPFASAEVLLSLPR